MGEERLRKANRREVAAQAVIHAQTIPRAKEVAPGIGQWEALHVRVPVFLC